MRASITGPLAVAMLVLAGAAQAAPSFGISGGSSIVDVANDFLWIDSNVTEGGDARALRARTWCESSTSGRKRGSAATEFWFGALAPPGGTLRRRHELRTSGQGGSDVGRLVPPRPGSRGTSRPTRWWSTWERCPSTSGCRATPTRSSRTAEARSARATSPSGGRDRDRSRTWSTSLLDDSGGFNPGDPSDNDHDDMVVRLTALPVPEPAAGALTLLGLLGLATRARRLRGEGRVRL